MCVHVFYERDMWCVYMCTVTEICEVCIRVLLQRYLTVVYGTSPILFHNLLLFYIQVSL